MFPTNRFLVVLAVGVALVAAGCGSSNKKSSASSNTTTTTSTTSAAGASTVALSADPGGGVAFTQTSATAKPGKVTIVMKNPSSSGLQHGIAVEGNGVDKDGPIVAPGKASTLTVSLKAGKYEFYCPFDRHKNMGMKGTLTVGSSSTSSSGSSSGGSSSGGSSSGTSTAPRY
jgi:uncharacterized cupredoxin-like copper-binding protein